MNPENYHRLAVHGMIWDASIEKAALSGGPADGQVVRIGTRFRNKCC
jgi:hypothetical protein